MNSVMHRRLHQLEQQGVGPVPPAGCVAIATVAELGKCWADAVASIDTLRLTKNTTLYMVEGDQRLVSPTAIDDLGAEVEKAWAAAAGTFPHVLAVVRDDMPIIVRFENAAASRRYNQLSIEDRATLFDADGFLWMKS